MRGRAKQYNFKNNVLLSINVMKLPESKNLPQSKTLLLPRGNVLLSIKEYPQPGHVACGRGSTYLSTRFQAILLINVPTAAEEFCCPLRFC